MKTKYHDQYSAVFATSDGQGYRRNLRTGQRVCLPGKYRRERRLLKNMPRGAVR